jgi:hypothetical protein
MSEIPAIKQWTIYKITNPTGQVYVGRTSIAQRGRGNKAVIQYDQNGLVIKEYESIRSAANEINISEHTIIRILKGRNKTPHKLIFKYK